MTEPGPTVTTVPSAEGRESLPIRHRPSRPAAAFDARDVGVEQPPIEPIRPPAGAPNVLLILVDDAGFGSNSAFGGPCRTPTFERLASGGLRYTRFHTTALCSPTRQALLTGRNHHSVAWARSPTWRPPPPATPPTSREPLARPADAPVMRYVRHPRARRYVLRVLPDGTVRVTIAWPR